MNGDSLPGIMDINAGVVDELCRVLDSTAQHNWMKLVEHLTDYTHMDIVQLRNLAQQGQSPTRELMMCLQGQGLTIGDLAEVANKAGIFSIIDILYSYCQDEGIEVELLQQTKNWVGAKSCLHRSPYPTDIQPPSDTDEAYRRYNLPCPPHDLVEDDIKTVAKDGNSLSNRQRECDSRKDTLFQLPLTQSSSQEVSTPSEATPTLFEPPPTPAGLEEVRYEVLVGATSRFDRTPYKDGGHKVGEGGFGEVFQCILTLQDGPIHAAVKVLLNKSDPYSSETSTSSLDSVERQQFSTEIEALSKLSHKCLLPVLAYSCNGPQLCLIYPFMTNGSLEAHLPNQDTLPPPVRLQVACDVASALHYLHSLAERTIVHRDVKSANILLSEKWRGRLGDFGLARALPSSQQQHSGLLTSTIVGTGPYMAPEVIGGTITSAADIYAFGVVLYELLTGKCALSKIMNELEEETDLLSYLEDFEGEQKDLLAGEWDEDVWQTMWSQADHCILKNTRKRPTSGELAEYFLKLQSLSP